MTETATNPTKTNAAQTAQIIADVLATLTADWQCLVRWQARNSRIAGELMIPALDVAHRMRDMGLVDIRRPAGRPFDEIRKSAAVLLTDRPIQDEMPGDSLARYTAWALGRIVPLTMKSFALMFDSLQDEGEYLRLAETVFGREYRDPCIELMQDVASERRIEGAVDRLRGRVDRGCATPSDVVLMAVYPAIGEALRAADTNS